MSEVMSMETVNQAALEAIVQQHAGLQAVAEQIVALAGSTARAIAMSKQAVNGVTEVKAEVADIRKQVEDIERNQQLRIRIDEAQVGALYQAVHEKGGEIARKLDDNDPGKHIRIMWSKIKRDLVLNSYKYMLEKDFKHAMDTVACYAGLGRNWTTVQR